MSWLKLIWGYKKTLPISLMLFIGYSNKEAWLFIFARGGGLEVMFRRVSIIVFSRVSSRLECQHRTKVGESCAEYVFSPQKN